MVQSCFDLDQQVGVGEPHAVAGGRAEHVGIGLAADRRLIAMLTPARPMTLPVEAVDLARRRRVPPVPPSRVWPGSKRTAVPAAMSRRIAARLRAVEAQRGVGFEEVVVRADLDRPVAGVGHGQRERAAAGVEFDLAGLDDAFRRESWLSPQTIGWWTVTSLVPSGKVASTWMSGIISGTPSITSSRREQGGAVAHQLGDAAAVARAFHDGGADEGDRLGIVELEAARLAPLGQQCGGEEQQLVLFAWGQFHASLRLSQMRGGDRIAPDQRRAQQAPQLDQPGACGFAADRPDSGRPAGRGRAVMPRTRLRRTLRQRCSRSLRFRRRPAGWRTPAGQPARCDIEQADLADECAGVRATAVGHRGEIVSRGCKSAAVEALTRAGGQGRPSPSRKTRVALQFDLGAQLRLRASNRRWSPAAAIPP